LITFSKKNIMLIREKRIQKELIDITRNSPPGVTASPIVDALGKWNATITGPSGSPYEEGTFELKVEFPTEYPFKPPYIIFKTKIYHCNIDSKGRICLDILKDKWAPSLTISKVLLSIRSLLSDPNPSDPLVPSIAKLLIKNREKHDQRAREYTARNACKHKFL
jgi:ubiquitin-protein ligase